MRRNRFRPDDDAVSTVVGVVLLIGIAVMLMATIGAFVLGFGPADRSPESDIQFHEEGGNVTITVVRPAGIEAQNLEIRANGTDACKTSGWSPSGSLDPSDSLTIRGEVGDCSNPTSIPSDTTIRVIWKSPSGGSSDIVGEYETA